MSDKQDTLTNIMDLSKLPLSFLAKVDNEKSVTVPYWINLDTKSSHLIEIENLTKERKYTKIVKIRKKGSLKQVNFGLRSSIVSPENKVLLTIVEPILPKLNILSTIENIEKSKFFNEEIYLSLFLIYYDETQINVLQEIDSKIMTIVKQEFFKDSVQILKSIHEIPRDSLELFDIKNYKDFFIIRYIGTKEVLDIELYKEGVVKSKQTSNFVLGVLASEALLCYLLDESIRKNLEDFSKKSKFLSLYQETDLTSLISDFERDIQSKIIERNILFKKSNSLFDIIFRLKIPNEYQPMSDTLSEIFAEGTRTIKLDEFLTVLKSKHVKKSIELKTVREALSWLIKEEVISPGKEDDKSTIFVRNP